VKTLHLVLVSLFLSGCSIASPSITATPTIQKAQIATLTNTPSITNTPDLWGTQLAIVGATQTAQVAKSYAIKTEKVNKTMAILEQIKKASIDIEGLDISNAKLTYGPEKGLLSHAIDGKVTLSSSNLSLKNFIVSITFINPYDTSTTGTWDYGIVFRNEHRNNQYRLTIFSNQSWSLVDARTWTDIFSKNDEQLKAAAGEENTIWLVAQDANAYLFIDGSYTQSLDIGAKLTAGDISAATGLYYGNETDKKTTKFYDFIVWSLP
jgi:hypothetical protein